jgi:hypothetical protein
MEHFYLYMIVWYFLGLAGTSYMLYDDHIKGCDIRFEQLLIGAFISTLGPIQILIVLTVIAIDHINIQAILEHIVIKGRKQR